MNKFLLAALFLLGCLHSNAQKPNFGLKVNPYVGYETNLLKSPMNYVPSSGKEMGLNDLWINAPYVGINNRFSIADQKKRNTLELHGNYRKSIVQPNDMVSASDLFTGISYRFNNQKKLKNELKFGFRNYVKTGEDQDNIIGVPLSYNRINFSNSLNLKLSKKLIFNVRPNATIKNYSRDGFDRFLYLENGLQSGLTYRYNLKRKVGFGLFAEVRQRNYFINKETEMDFEDEELEIEDETDRRIWRYYTGGLGLRIPVNKKLKIITRADYTFRQDILQGLLGYHQYELRMGLNYKFKKWKWDLTTTAFFRDYTDFMVTSGQGKTKLDYTYIRYTTNVKYALTDNFSFVLRSGGKMRFSNVNDINRRAFRSYMIGEVSVGFIYNLKSGSRLKTSPLR